MWLEYRFWVVSAHSKVQLILTPFHLLDKCCLVSDRKHRKQEFRTMILPLYSI